MFLDIFHAFLMIYTAPLIRSMWPLMMLWGPRKDWLDQVAESQWKTIWPDGSTQLVDYEAYK